MIVVITKNLAVEKILKTNKYSKWRLNVGHIELNAHNLSIFQPILMILVSKFMVHRALSDKTYLSLGLLSPLTYYI